MILTQEKVLSSNRDWIWTSTLYRSSWQQTLMFKTGPILVFLRIHLLKRVSLSFRGIVYSRHKCGICCPSSVSRVQKYCPFPTSFKPASEHRLNNFWSSDNCSNFRSYSCTRFLRCCALVKVSSAEGRVGISIVSKWSGAASFTGAQRSLGNSLHRSAIAP